MCLRRKLLIWERSVVDPAPKASAPDSIFKLVSAFIEQFPAPDGTHANQYFAFTSHFLRLLVKGRGSWLRGEH